LVFDHVSFWYNKGDQQVVKDADFVLSRGKTVAVVGSTGSGKTTLANLLARFYDPTSGRVMMDGIDLREMATADLRSLIGVVTQETILFNTTIEENIAYGTKNATQEQIKAAAEMANAHSFIINHPDGYKRIVGDKGFVLSGGERQRVAIARAILKNPPILILDEATSALDTVTEQQVQEAITHLMENRTVFVIAHRLSTVQNADTILVMDHGSIIESGSHDVLYAKGGVYANLCDVQKSVK
jgi:subfamily B ATP-binding cassette protein MsbA